MTVALVLLALMADDRSQAAIGLGIVIFGLGFGMVTQILVLAVQNSVDRSELGVATATTGFFRALGGAIGAAASAPCSPRAAVSSTACRPCSSWRRPSPRSPS